MHSYWNACLFGFEYFQEIPTDLVHLISPHSPTQDITHYISREWSISPPPRSAASHLRPTLLVETAPCPAWARVRVGWARRLGHSRQLTARLLQVYRVFLACHRKKHALQLQIPAINKIPANWANTSSKSFPHNKWNNETSGCKCKKPFVINEKMVVMLPNW